MHYVYVLKSKKDNKLYVGYTENLIRRFKEHQEGKSLSTKNRRPLQIVYYEACVSKRDALIRERYLKSAWGKRYIKNRVRHSAQLSHGEESPNTWPFNGQRQRVTPAGSNARVANRDVLKDDFKKGKPKSLIISGQA